MAPLSELLSRMWAVWMLLAFELVIILVTSIILLIVFHAAIENEKQWIAKRNKRIELYSFVGTIIVGLFAQG